MATPLKKDGRFSNYYTSSDTFLYIEAGDSIDGDKPIFIDKLESIGYSESTSAMPVYGIGDPIFGFTNMGNIVVRGELSLRFIHEDYLLVAIRKVLGVENEPSPISRREFLYASSVDSINQKKDTSNQSSIISKSRLLDLPLGFNLRLVFNNEDRHHKDSPKNILIKDVRILSYQQSSGVGMTGPINIRYSFIAKSISSTSVNS